MNDERNIEHSETTYVGHQVIDPHGEVVGKVSDVVFDESTGKPEWMAVHVKLGGDHYVPVADSYRSEDGNVVVPFDRAKIKKAPKAHKDHVMTEAMHRDAVGYYGPVE